LSTERIVMRKKYKTTVQRFKFCKYGSFIKTQALENMPPRWGRYQKHDSFPINIRPHWGQNWQYFFCYKHVIPLGFNNQN
jgi:hypothetical protein